MPRSSGPAMNLALSDEQDPAPRGRAQTALSRHRTIEAARAALEDPAALPDLWPTAVEAGWTGLLVSEEHGGAELDAFDAMLVAEECGRVLAPVPLLGVLPATAVLDRAGHAGADAVAAGEVRAVVRPRAPALLDSSRAGRSSPTVAWPARRAPRASIDGDEVDAPRRGPVRARPARRRSARAGRRPARMATPLVVSRRR